MIYFASDMHAESTEALREYERIAKPDDLLIILGDLYIKVEDTEENRLFTEYVMSIKANIALVDGNHDNHDYLNSFPVEEWCGGHVHRITPSFVHLMRGNVFTIDGLNFLVMGGCKSSARWKDAGLYFEGEDPNEEEIALGYKNYEKYNIDYVLTHKREGGDLSSAPRLSLEGFIHHLNETQRYKGWLYGHWHVERRSSEKLLSVYDRLISLEDIENGKI